MRWLLTVVLLSVCVLPAYAADPIEESVAKLGLSKEQLLKMGDSIYNTDGENTCLKCHGKSGTGGDQAGAADLRHPKTWRVYQALGGDEAMKANKEKFLKDIDAVVHDLIRNGATSWNLKFPKEHKEIALDWGKVTVPDKADKYNQMMKGITSDPMVKKVKELQEQLEKDGKKLTAQQIRDVAAVSDFMYVKTLDDGSDKGGVFK
jgi:mono/diheme cytochrome c family protein